MSNITIEVKNAAPIKAMISNEDRFSIKNALLSKTLFISFTDAETSDEWIIRTDEIVIVNMMGGIK